MTGKSVSEMTDEELNTALAVAKWGVVVDKDGRWEVRDKRGNFITRSGMWQPSTDIAQAMICLEGLGTGGWEILSRTDWFAEHYPDTPRYWCSVEVLADSWIGAEGRSVERAICEAVLKATREKEAKNAAVPDA